MDIDDLPVGRVLTRREALTLLGSTGLVLLTGCSAKTASTSDSDDDFTDVRSNSNDMPTTCVVRPEMTEGPYFVDERLNRSDIRSDPSDGTVKPGALLDLTFNVSRITTGGCAALAGALVDVWHCDHLGVYSDVQDPGFDTAGRKFLRGYQVTDADGLARFTTTYPGWYRGRAVHIHFKIRSAPAANSGFEFTSQLFFDDELTDQVHAQQPYAVEGQRTRNSQDGIFARGGSQLLLAVNRVKQGYAATFDIALQTG